MNRVQLIVPLTSEADFEIFRSITSSCVELSLEKSRGLNATEFADTLIITILTSAAYDAVKLSTLALISKIREYIKTRSTNLSVTFNGVQYPMKHEADVDQLERDVIESINDDADSNKRD